MEEYTYPSFDDTSTLWRPSKGQALRASLALRIMHSLIRISPPNRIHSPALDDPSRVLLNQEDLLATLLSFSITVFEVLEQFGISWTAEEQEAYFYVWDRVGETLGIGDTARHPRTHGERDPWRISRGRSAVSTKGTSPRTDEEEPPDQMPAANRRPAGSPAGSHVTPEDIDELFKGPINRRVLRHVADVGTLRPRVRA